MDFLRDIAHYRQIFDDQFITDGRLLAPATGAKVPIRFSLRFHRSALSASNTRWKKNCRLPLTLTPASIDSSRRSAIDRNACADGASEVSSTTICERATARINSGSLGIQPNRSNDALRKRSAGRESVSKMQRASSSPETLLARMWKRFW